MLNQPAIFCLITVVGFGATDGYVPKVKTPYGVVVGYHKKSYNERIYSAFEGIPYAKKPIGELRFEVGSSANHWISEKG